MLSRAFRLVTRPAAEWATIACERAGALHILARYVLPLSAIPAAAWMFGLANFGLDLNVGDEAVKRFSREQILRIGVISYLTSVLSVLGLAAAIYLIAPMYAAVRDWHRSVAVAAYGTTPLWLVGFLLVRPRLITFCLVALVHACYLYYTGLRQVAGVRPNDAAEYVAMSLFLTGAVSILAGGLLGSLDLI